MRTGLSILALLFAVGCASSSQGTSSGNPVVAMKFAAYNSAASSKARELSSVDALAVSSVKMCFKRLRFKQASGDSNVDLALGEVTLSPSGTELANVSVPAGTYTRIELDLDDECGSGQSLSVTNGNGSFATDEGMTIKFDGSFTYTGDSRSLELAVQAVVSALGAVTNSSQLRSAAEGASGSF